MPIDDLRVEWPVDDSLGSWMSCIGGVGGNYAPPTIDKLPAGQGQVWDTLATLPGPGKKGNSFRWQFLRPGQGSILEERAGKDRPMRK